MPHRLTPQEAMFNLQFYTVSTPPKFNKTTIPDPHARSPKLSDPNKPKHKSTLHISSMQSIFHNYILGNR